MYYIKQNYKLQWVTTTTRLVLPHGLRKDYSVVDHSYFLRTLQHYMLSLASV